MFYINNASMSANFRTPDGKEYDSRWRYACDIHKEVTQRYFDKGQYITGKIADIGAPLFTLCAAYPLTFVAHRKLEKIQT
jgi:hypothetical protein